MLPKLRGHLTYANVMSTLAVFFALAGGSAVALSGTNTVFTDDIVNDQVASADVRNDNLSGGGLFAHDLAANSVRSSEVENSSLTGADITNGSLNDEDVGQATLINFEAFIGIVNANSCVARAMTGVSAQGDHLLLTPNVDLNESNPNLVYEAEYAADGSVEIHVCNPTGTGFNDGNTSFNLLVFDAQ